MRNPLDIGDEEQASDTRQAEDRILLLVERAASGFRASLWDLRAESLHSH